MESLQPQEKKKTTYQGRDGLGMAAVDRQPHFTVTQGAVWFPEAVVEAGQLCANWWVFISSVILSRQFMPS